MDKMVKRQCSNILSEVMNHPYGCIFNQPVDPVKLRIPDYFSVISEPMDLGTIKKKLDGNKYSSLEEFAADVGLTFSNAMLYNPSDHVVHKWANHFNGYVDKKWELFEAKLKHNGPTPANDESQDSGRSVRESYLDNKKERKIGVDARAGKTDRLFRGIKRRADNEVVPKEKTKLVNTNSPHSGSDDNAYIKSVDCSKDDEYKMVADLSHGIKNSESGVMRKGFEDFEVRVNGETLNSEIPPDIRMKYYQLCCTQEKLIHDRIVKGLDRKSVVSMILKIVSIDDAIKVSNITSPNDLERMRKAIKSFQDLGMAVRSLHTKICTLIKFSETHQAIEESMRVKVAKVEKEKKALQETDSKIEELKESAKARGALIGDMEVNIEALKEKREKLRFVFNEVAALTW